MFPRSIFAFLALVAPFVVLGQTTPQVVPLWENGAPGFESRRAEPEEAKDYWVRNIHNPSLTVFRAPADKANGCAIIVAPGGGFRELVFGEEGEKVAAFLNPLGVTVFVLKYRLPNQEGSPYTLAHVQQDGRRAVRLVRRRAAEFGADPKRIGMLGFSAGGGVAMMMALAEGAAAPQASDPVDGTDGHLDFVMLVYPGGPVPAAIPADAPPAWLLCANDDEYHCDETTMLLVERYRAAGIPVELHLLARGKHAFNMGDRSEFQSVRHWPQRLAEWLEDSGYLKSGGQ